MSVRLPLGGAYSRKAAMDTHCSKSEALHETKYDHTIKLMGSFQTFFFFFSLVYKEQQLKIDSALDYLHTSSYAVSLLSGLGSTQIKILHCDHLHIHCHTQFHNMLTVFSMLFWKI